jgi:hypothetical protein
MKHVLPIRTATTVLFAALSSVSVAGFAYAQTALSYPTQDNFLTTADEALDAMTQVQNARLALFNNDIAEATDSVQAAISALSESESHLSELMMRDFTFVDTEHNFLPFEMSMSLTEDFTATEETAQALQRAGDLFASDAPDDAVDVLRLAEIDVGVSTAMLPFEPTLQHLDDAMAHIGTGDYFEANLDLLAINDSVVVNTFPIDAIPQQGGSL